MISAYISPEHTIIDLCSGIGRTKEWINEITKAEMKNLLAAFSDTNRFPDLVTQRPNP